jgi:hypothetical protein
MVVKMALGFFEGSLLNIKVDQFGSLCDVILSFFDV